MLNQDGSTNEPSRFDHTAVRWAAVAALTTLIYYLTLMRQLIADFRVYYDDACVVVNSCLPWFPLSRWGEWFTSGWAQYSVNYPDWMPFGNNTLKPVINLTFFLEGLLRVKLGDAAFLIAPYAALAVTGFALVYVFRRFTQASGPVCALLSVCVTTSAFWILSLLGAVGIVCTFVLMFTSVALAVLPTGAHPASLLRQFGLLALMLLAIFSHETALVVPLVCVAFLFAFSDRRPTTVDLWPFLAAPLIWAVARFVVLQSESGVYALNLAVFTHAKTYGWWLATALAPLDMSVASQLARNAPVVGVQDPMMAAALLGIVAVNAAFLVLIAVRIRSLRVRRTFALACAFLLASAPHLLTAASGNDAARFAGVTMVVGIVLCFSLAKPYSKWLTVAAGVLLAAQLAYNATGLVGRRDVTVLEMKAADSFIQYAGEAINKYHPDRVVVVNDVVGVYSVPAMLKFSAWPYQDFDTTVISNYTYATSGPGDLSIENDGRVITISTYTTPPSSFAFLGADAVDFDTANQGFEYSLLAGSEDAPTAFTARGEVGEGSTLILGYEPTQVGMVQPVFVRGSAQ